MKIYLAPIKGITDCVYREAFANHFKGVDLAYAPFVSSVSSRKIKSSHLIDLLPANNKRMKVIPQVLSKDPDDFIFMAEHVFELGYDEINWNLGCPTPMVAKKERGSGLLPYPDRIEAFLAKVTARFPQKISIKTRLGRHDADEILTLMPIFNRYPLKSLIIHPRLGVQMYKGEVDLDGFTASTKLNKLPLIYNGDINNLEMFNNLQERFSEISGWMLGRGVLKNPYLPAMIKKEKVEISRSALLAFHDEIYAGYLGILEGPGHQVARLKGFWFYFSHIFQNRKACHKRITKAKSVQQYLDSVKINFEEEELIFL